MWTKFIILLKFVTHRFSKESSSNQEIVGCLFKRFTEEYDDMVFCKTGTIDSRLSILGINVTVQIRQITTESNIYTVLSCF